MSVRLGPSALDLETLQIRTPRPSRRIDLHSIAFWLCCAYVVSQVYMVPVWLVGPSWSVWPSITDLVVALMFVCLFFVRRDRPNAGPEVRTIKRYLLVLAVCSVVSYLTLTLNLLGLKTVDVFSDKGQYFGLYQLYRFGQFLTVFWLVTRIDLDARRKVWLRRCIAFTFWASSASVLANYFGLIDTPMLAPQIPKDLGVAGPWAFYSLGVVGRPVGGISFHHAYPTVQLLVLSATYLCFLAAECVWLPSAILTCLWGCGLVSGSRAGFVAVCLFVAIVVLTRPRRLLALTVVVVFGALAWVYASADFASTLAPALDRQKSITTSYDEDGLAGRVEIWSDRVALLNENPAFWLTGTGFGSAAESGSNGHMLYLHITLEAGLVGCVIFLVFFQRVGVFLWRAAANGRIMCYATVALLVSAVSQETFYPVPALGHFCGMYLFSAAAILSTNRRVSHSRDELWKI